MFGKLSLVAVGRLDGSVEWSKVPSVETFALTRTIKKGGGWTKVGEMTLEGKSRAESSRDTRCLPGGNQVAGKWEVRLTPAVYIEWIRGGGGTR